MTLISSLGNPKVKQVRSLRQRKGRSETGLFIVEGIRHVGEAIEAAGTSGLHPAVVAIYYAPDLLTSAFAHELITAQSAGGVPCYALSAEVFSSIADKDNPQGILAVLRRPEQHLSSLNPDNFSWGVALVAPQDPGNLGAILRSIDAVGASGLLLIDNSVDAYHPAAVRASMGALFWYPVVNTSFAAFTCWAGEKGYTIYGTSAHGDADYRTVGRYTRPAILLMGSEREGLSPEQVEVCHALIRLPMRGRASSLNLAVATGVMLYAMLEALSL